MKTISRKIVGIVFFTIAVILIALMFIPTIKGMRVYYKVGDVADKNIFANRDVEDVEETKKLQKIAEDAIPIQTSLEPSIGNKTSQNLNKLFEEILKYRNDTNTQNLRKVSIMNSSSEFIKKYEFSVDDLKAVLEFSAEDYLNLRSGVETLLKEKYEAGIYKGQEEEVIEDLNQQYTHMVDSPQKVSIAAKIFQKEVEMNMLDDLKKTSEMKKAAREEVSPVMIKKGSLIIFQGMKISQREISLLKECELILPEGKTDPLLWLGSIIAIILVSLMLYLGLYALDSKFLGSVHFFISMAVLLITVFISFSASKIGLEIVPIVFSVVLLSFWVDGEISVWINVFAVWILHFLIGLSPLYTAILTLQVFALSVLIYRAKDFYGRFKVAMFTSIVSIILMLSADLISKSNISGSILSVIAKLLTDGISAVVAVFLAPLFNKNLRKPASSSVEDEFEAASKEIHADKK